jgi:type II secretory ATPase GspE/PulE/Tfp pilus assembly ATPase PilB-like protein
MGVTIQLQSKELNRFAKGSILDYLVTIGYLTDDQKQVLLLERRKTGKRIEQLLLDLHFLQAEEFLSFLSEYTGLPIYNETVYPFDPLIIRTFPQSEAQLFQVLPLFQKEDNLFVVMVDPDDVRALDRVQHFFPALLRLNPLLTSEAKFLWLLDTVYADHAENALRPVFSASLSTSSTLSTSPPISPPISTSPPIRELQENFDAITFTERMIEQAVKERASDIHLEPDENMVRIRFRIDGILRLHLTLHRSQWSALNVRLKIMAGMNIAEARLPQDGRFTLKIGGRLIDFRMATHPILYGENIVIRILDKLHSLRALEELGFDAQQVAILKRLARQPEGIVILTGPTGSGKTTTLYSLLNYIRTRDLNIMTLEEPVEYEIKGIQQTEIKDIGGVSFAEGIRSILRQDPDIIFVGEVRDSETAQMAIRAAMTGHLVLTTLHANDSLSTIHRLDDLGLSASMLMSNLLAIVSQRLVRRLCHHCKQPEGQLFIAKGCPECHMTGYKGRLAVGEVLEIDDDLETMIADARPLPLIKQYARTKGFQDLKTQAQQLVTAGVTSLEEVQRVIRRFS